MTEQAGMPLTESKKPRFFYGYVIVLIAFCVIAVGDGALHSFGVFLEPLLTEFGWTTAATSGAYSLFMVLAGLLAIGMGRLNDRLGPRLVVTACGFFLGLGYLLMSQISAIWHLYLFYSVIAAIGMSAEFVPVQSTVARWFSKRRGMMTGIVLASIGVGTMIVPPTASRLIISYGWRTSYFVVGLVVFVVIILVAQFLKRDPSQIGELPYGAQTETDPKLNSEAAGFSLQEAIRTTRFWMLTAMGFCLSFCVSTIMVHIVRHATELGVAAITAANILMMIGGVSIAGRITMGSASDKIGMKLAYIIGFILLSVAFFWLITAKEMWMLYLFAAIFGFGYGGLVAVMSPMVAELFGLKSHSAIMASAMFGGTIGNAVGPVLAGRIFDVTASYQSAFLICAALAVIGIILSVLIRMRGSK